MAPKSWAIAHPEKSAIMLALPMRAFMWLTRPVLRALNETANWCLRKVGVDPDDAAGTGQDSAALRHLVEHSVNVGALDASYSAQFSEALELETMTLADIVRRTPLTAVPASATVGQVQEISRASGHLRILVREDAALDGAVDGAAGGVIGMVHVRDTLVRPGGAGIAEMVRPVDTLAGATTIYDALAHMRRAQQPAGAGAGGGRGGRRDHHGRPAQPALPAHPGAGGRAERLSSPGGRAVPQDSHRVSLARSPARAYVAWHRHVGKRADTGRPFVRIHDFAAHHGGRFAPRGVGGGRHSGLLVRSWSVCTN